MRPQAQAWKEALEPTLHAFRAVRQGKLIRKEGNQFFWDLYRQTHVSWLTGITRTFTDGVCRRTISDGYHLRATELGRRNRRRKRYEARAWEAPQAIPRTMEVVLGGRRPSHRAGVGGKLEGEKSVKTQALSQW